MKAVKLIVLATLAAGSIQLNAESITGKAKFHDGDSVRIGDARIRLNGIDAPELKQQCNRWDGTKWWCGRHSVNALRKMVGQKDVKCDITGSDRYGRLLAYCYVGGESINKWMVENGWALAYRKYSMKYVAAEKKAVAYASGIHDGTFTKPWDWRKSRK